MCTYINQDIPVCVLSSVSLEISLKSKLSPHQTVLCAWSEMTWHCWNMSQFWAPAAQCLWKNPPKKTPDMFVYKTRTVEQLCWLVWRKSPEPQSESTSDKSGDSGVSSYVFAGRARTYQRVIKWMENPISVSARIMRFPLLSAGIGDIYVRNCCLSERDKSRETAGGERTEWYTLKWFSQLVRCPIFMGKKKTKLKLHHFTIWSAIFSEFDLKFLAIYHQFCFFFAVSHYFHSYGAVDVLS